MDKKITLNDIKELVTINFRGAEECELDEILHFKYDEQGDQEEYIEKFKHEKFTYDGNFYEITALFCLSDGNYYDPFGYIIFKNDKLYYFVEVFDGYYPHINLKKGLVSFCGNDEYINLWLDDDYYDVINL